MSFTGSTFRLKFSGSCYFSLRKLAKALKKRWGTNVITHTSQSLLRLRAVPLFLNNAYFDSTKKQTLEVLDTFNILSDLKIIKRKEHGHITKEEGYFKFNDFILKNIFNNYSKPVLLEVVLSFKSEIAQLLYTHLDLMLARRSTYERKTRELFLDDLGLDGKAYRNVSNRVQKLKPALDELTGIRLSTGFIISATLEKTADGKDYKIVIVKDSQQQLALVADADVAEVEAEPAITAEPPEPTKPTSHLTDQARELVEHFYQRFHGITHSTSKAISQAVALIAQHGTELARFIVDFAHREAGKTKYQPQTFGGILQYVPRAVAEHTNENAHRKAQQAMTDCTLCDRNGYATFTNEQGSGTAMQCPHNLDTIHTIDTPLYATPCLGATISHVRVFPTHITYQQRLAGDITVAADMIASVEQRMYEHGFVILSTTSRRRIICMVRRKRVDALYGAIRDAHDRLITTSRVSERKKTPLRNPTTIQAALNSKRGEGSHHPHTTSFPAKAIKA